MAKLLEKLKRHIPHIHIPSRRRGVDDTDRVVHKSKPMDIQVSNDIPRVLLIASSKGGVGKSYIASSLAVLYPILVSGYRVFLVDADTDNQSSYMRLETEKIREMIMRDGGSYLSFSDFLLDYELRTNRILVVRHHLKTCAGELVESKIGLIPAFNVAKETMQRRGLMNLSTDMIRVGMKAMFNTLLAKDDTLLLVDAKPKGIGLKGEPIYPILAEYSDVILVVTEYPHLNYTVDIEQFRNLASAYNSKLIVVINKASSDIPPNILKSFLISCLENDTRFWLVPRDEEASSIYMKNLHPPPLHSMNYRSIQSLLAMLKFFSLVPDKAVDSLMCSKVDSWIDYHVKLYRKLGVENV